jgi:hypothetical protein
MFALSSGRLGQVQILAAIVFLFLIPTTVIIAQNATNSSNTSFENLTLEGNMIAPVNASDIANQSQEEQPPENQSSETFNSSSDFVDEEPSPPLNQTLNETAQNETINETLNVTEPLNQTLPDGNVTSPRNETELQNQTLNETAEIPPSSEPPVLAVSIQGPEKITRGEDITFSAEITNEGNGTAFGVQGYWDLPETEERPEFVCGDMGPGETCTRELVLPTDAGTPLGAKEIGVFVRYG